MRYASEIIDHFIPKTLKQVKILKSFPLTPDFVDLDAKFRKILQNPLGMDPFQNLLITYMTWGRGLRLL